MTSLFRSLPSTDACLAFLEARDPAWFAALPRTLLRDTVTAFLDTQRAAIKNGTIPAGTDPARLTLDGLGEALLESVRAAARPRFRRLLNATGVVLHTNMGRAVLAEEAVEAMRLACGSYSNLELDLATGERGSRYSHVEELLCRLTGAEAALVVNNNAAAVLLTLDALCKGQEVVVARGQLVEIGGSFRIPEVMARSGARLREVGCTNRVHLADYAAAITPDCAALMRVHTSNYRVVGFHAEVGMAELASLAHERGLLCLEDLGSGSLVDFAACGLPGEPTVRAVVEAGVDVVTFSGDKVLGGPQAGLIVGRREALARLKASPLNRALRIDKMTLAALEATLRLYLDEERAKTRIPTLRMIFASPQSLRRKAEGLARRLRRALGETALVRLVPGASRVGGGAFPEHDLPTTLVALSPRSMTPENLRERLLRTDPPVIARIEREAFCLDPRTLDDANFPELVRTLALALGSAPSAKKES